MGATLGTVWVRRAGVWAKYGRSDQAPPVTPGTPGSTSRDSLVYGTYEPDGTTTGVLSGTVLTDYNPPTTQTVTFTAGGLIENKRIYGDIKMRANANLTIRNCELTGGDFEPASGNTGVVDCNGAHTGILTLIDCTIHPVRPSARRDTVVGHRYEAYRNNVYHGVDGFGAFITTARGNAYVPATNRADVKIAGNWVHSLSYFYPDVANPNHTDGTHNDGVQIQGGRYIQVWGNCFDGSVIQRTGDHPTMQSEILAGYAPGAGVLIQDNTGAGLDDSVWVHDNWYKKWQAHANFKPGAYRYTNNHHYRDSYSGKKMPAGTGTWAGYWARIDPVRPTINGLTHGPDTNTNTWVDGPYVGQALVSPRDRGIDLL